MRSHKKPDEIKMPEKYDPTDIESRMLRMHIESAASKAMFNGGKMSEHIKALEAYGDEQAINIIGTLGSVGPEEHRKQNLDAATTALINLALKNNSYSNAAWNRIFFMLESAKIVVKSFASRQEGMLYLLRDIPTEDAARTRALIGERYPELALDSLRDLINLRKIFTESAQDEAPINVEITRVVKSISREQDFEVRVIFLNKARLEDLSKTLEEAITLVPSEDSEDVKQTIQKISSFSGAFKMKFN